MCKGVGHVHETGPAQVGERCDVIRVEVGDEDVGNVLRSKVECRKLIDHQIFFVKRHRSHPAIKTLGKIFGLIEEAVGIARIEKHRAEFRVTQQREHSGKMDRAPTSAVNGDVFGSGAVTSVENVDFHKFNLNTKVTKYTKFKSFSLVLFVYFVFNSFPSTIVGIFPRLHQPKLWVDSQVRFLQQ